LSYFAAKSGFQAIYGAGTAFGRLHALLTFLMSINPQHRIGSILYQLNRNTLALGLGGDPMSVSLDLVTSISRAVAAETGLDVQLITVASANAEAHRVELLITFVRPSFEARRILLNLSRKEPAAFERQLRAKLYEIGKHRCGRARASW
jgi:hypothetical protein